VEVIHARIGAARVEGAVLGPATEVLWGLVGFGYTLEPGGTCPLVTAGAVCAQALVAPLVEDPEFGDALNRMSIRGMTGRTSSSMGTRRGSRWWP
jgi:hypothetical protein